MKFIITTLCFLISFIFFADNSTIYACTIISVSSGKIKLFGGNEEQSPNSSFLVVDKRGTFGVIYFATPWKEWPLVMQMGINEKGLCYDANWIPEEKLNPHPERKRQNEWAVTQLMRENATVKEVISKLSAYSWGNSISYQLHFADKTGDAVIIHPGLDGELAFSRKSKNTDYLISTNFNHSRRVKESWSFRDFAYWLIFDSKYKTANNMLSQLAAENNFNMKSIASVLKATHRDWFFKTRFSIKTLYSAVYDLQNTSIHLYLSGQFDKPYVFDVRNELAKKGVYRKISLEELISNKNYE
jgi:hypothetical protein